MEIGYLVDHPEYFQEVNRWLFREWGEWYPDYRNEIEYRERIRLRLNRERVPTILVAFADDEPLGTASLLERDMEDRPDLTPWLASVYVRPESRGRGVGSALVERAQEEARKIGVHGLYLFTPDRETFYARLGWKTVERTEYRGEEVAIMARDLRGEACAKTRQGRQSV